MTLSEAMNPLVPTHWESTMLLITGALIALVVVAVISLSRDRHCTPDQRLLWLFVILVVPVLGPVLWLTVGRTRAPGQKER